MKSGDLSGIFCLDIHYNGIHYELAYRIEYNDQEEIIVVILAGTRESFYEELKRYMS
ncbi:type II toxin-antitoxin system RelE/ParE family toxin [Alkalibacillus salilacus]|uniref:Component of toxin-antitoxin plasmid stabilization module n=1 Tax=Alkalibacillus salilacus TaxID=284582 RepID=A0ABT9VB80_9BACI|nr:type II toxin-antitoxin system RelE/ParE family toxin [Alkalibacillus salilacus]MDQ0158165.1 putative component of toxin-antitoxin plasmid stabilization module [Alkalibacillus salilacus]